MHLRSQSEGSVSALVVETNEAGSALFPIGGVHPRSEFKNIVYFPLSPQNLKMFPLFPQNF